MPNAFTLFGEIKVNTQGFEHSLQKAETRLNQTERAVSDLERKSAGLGKTTAVSGRQFEKMTDAVKQNRDRMRQAVDAYSRGEISQTKLASVLRQTDTRVNSLNSRLKDHSARLLDAQAKTGQWFQSLSRFNTHILLAGAVIGGFALKAGVDLENLKNKFMAVEGSAELANKRIEKLKTLARGNVGVTIGDAGEAFSFLKQLKVGESAIDSVTKALGKLKLGFGETMHSSTDFLINMQQLFDQGFEAQDIKQAIGRVPIFETLLEQAFGTKDTEKLRQLKAAGTLTLDTFMSGLAEAVNTNESLGRLQETTSTKLGKIFDEIKFATGTGTEQFLAFLRPELDAALTSLQQQDYSGVGNAIGRAIGKSIGASLRAALESEASAGGGVSFGGLTDSILEGFNADSGATVVRTFFNRLGAEVAKGIVDLSATVINLTPGALGEKLLKQMGFDTSHMPTEQINSYFREQRAEIEQRYNQNAIEILNASKAAADKIATDSSVTDAIRASAQRRSDELQKQIEAMTASASKAAAQQGAEQAKRSLDSVLHKVPTEVSGLAKQGGMSIGQNIAAGMAAGISGNQSGVINAAIGLAQSAWQSAKNALGIQSPSKVFKAIGQDVGQGFIDGIESMKTGVQKSMASILDVSGIFAKLGKKDAPGVQLLTELIKELDQLTPRTRLEAVMAELTAEKYKKLNEEVKKRIVLAAKQLDLEEMRQKRIEMAKERFSGLSDQDNPDFSSFLPTGEGLGLSDVFEEEIKQMEAAWDAFAEKIGQPPAIDTWANFWGGMQYHLQKFKETLPSINEALGVNLIDAISGVGDVFANAVAYWDGTAKGFFQSLAQGFRQMIQQIIAELVRLMVMKAIMQLIGSFAGGIGGGASSGGGGGAVAPFEGFASGGYTGSGRASAIAGLVHKREFVMPERAVKKWGLPALEAMKNLQAPPPMSGGATTYNNSTSMSPTIIVNVPPGNPNPSAVRASAEQGAREAFKHFQKFQMRSK